MAGSDQDVTTVATADAPAGVVVREGDYGERVITVEPGGAEFIPLHERHGRPLQLFWTWTSPNLEFAAIFVGMLAVALFGLSFWQSVLAIVIGTAGAAVAQGTMSARGPGHGVPQMVLSRLGFGYWGNVLPAGLNSVAAGIGWFAVNSVSATFALNTLLHWPKIICLVIVAALQIAIASFGHNLVHTFERYAFPVLAVIFTIVTIVILTKSHPGASHHTLPGGFLLATGAVFGAAAGWSACAADYTRYLPPSTPKAAIAWWSAAGLFISCVVMETAGAASATAASTGASLGNPTGTFTSHLPTALADATLLAIALGSVCANVLNIYSGAMSFVAMGIRLTLALRRAIAALVFGVTGFIVAITGLHDAGAKYTNFLLIIAYWIAPWLAVMFCDQLLHRRRGLLEEEALLFDKNYTNRAGPVAMLIGVVVSVWLFSSQTEHVGLVPSHVPSVGDITFEAGLVITAVVYLAWHALAGHMRRPASARAQEPGSGAPTTKERGNIAMTSTTTSQIGNQEHDVIVTRAGYVPVIDLASARGQGAETRLAVAKTLGTVCETSGFFTVVGHGVPTTAVSGIYEATREFFALPDEQKAALRSAPDDPLMRGFGREGSVAAAAEGAPVAHARTLPDLAQTFIYNRLGEPGVAHLPAGADPMLAAPNLWPDLPGFADAYRRYYALMENLAHEIIRLFALALDLPETWFDDKIDDHMTNLVANYYPAQPTPPAPGQLRKGQHSDWGSLTILYQDAAPGGLQVLDKTGGWLDVPYVEGSFVVNIGDLMAVWTNDRWVSTVHRVVNPPREHADRERYSIPFFQQPNFDALIECIPTCTGAGNPPRHRAVRSGEYLMDKLRIAFGA